MKIFSLQLRKGTSGPLLYSIGVVPNWDSIYFKFEAEGRICLFITDGYYDRSYWVGEEDASKIKKGLGIKGKNEAKATKILYDFFDKKGEDEEKEAKMATIDYASLNREQKSELNRWGLPDRSPDFYLKKFEELCEKFGARYSFSSWMSGDAY